jgi:hypothetical protein
MEVLAINKKVLPQGRSLVKKKKVFPRNRGLAKK